MESCSYEGMSGSNTINTATVLLETGMLPMTEPVTEIALEAPAGLVRVRADCRDGRCERITFENVPSFATDLDAPVYVPGIGELRVDVAYGGAFCVFIDAEALGYAIVPEEARALADLGERILAAVAEQLEIAHPAEPALGVLRPRPHRRRRATAATPATPPSSPPAPRPLRDRTATSARLAVLAARGLIDDGDAFVYESVIGTRLVGRIASRTTVGDTPAIVPAISGRAWITGHPPVRRLHPGLPVPDRLPARRHLGAGL